MGGLRFFFSVYFYCGCCLASLALAMALEIKINYVAIVLSKVKGARYEKAFCPW